ncbi:radical SAM protein [Armatimonas rosea]|uniref:DNA repair photolyase n=1 Tax=Armatimonas rosea TaxID=685828 RepID=A0A7W9STC7_ARMRO|nr:DNA repair photolyase [Armatimonas rosea]
MLITEIEVRSVVTRQKNPGRIPFDITINPYRGCLFGCAYCYASEFVYEDPQKRAAWGQWVEVKKNAVDALQKESRKVTGQRVFFSSATDPYQPLERRLGLTRACLEVLLMAAPAHLHIQTRSPHITRDIELLQRFGESLTVGFSIPTDSDIVRKVFEPRAPSISRRLKAAKELHEAGIAVSASVAPLLPCTPKRLARLLAPVFPEAWVGGMNFHLKETELRQLYTERGWEHFLTHAHRLEVETALWEAGLLPSPPRGTIAAR